MSTPTNNQIKTAFYDLLIAANLGYPIAFPGVEFTPPDSGTWLEVRFFPNRGVDDRLANDSDVIPQGIFQVSCIGRPGSGTVGLGNAAQQVHGVFPKGTLLTGNVRTNRHPYDLELEPRDNQVEIAVSIDYSA